MTGSERWRGKWEVERKTRGGKEDERWWNDVDLPLVHSSSVIKLGRGRTSMPDLTS